MHNQIFKNNENQSKIIFFFCVWGGQILLLYLLKINSIFGKIEVIKKLDSYQRTCSFSICLKNSNYTTWHDVFNTGDLAYSRTAYNNCLCVASENLMKFAPYSTLVQSSLNLVKMEINCVFLELVLCQPCMIVCVWSCKIKPSLAGNLASIKGCTNDPQQGVNIRTSGPCKLIEHTSTP